MPSLAKVFNRRIKLILVGMAQQRNSMDDGACGLGSCAGDAPAETAEWRRRCRGDHVIGLGSIARQPKAGLGSRTVHEWCRRRGGRTRLIRTDAL